MKKKFYFPDKKAYIIITVIYIAFAIIGLGFTISFIVFDHLKDDYQWNSRGEFGYFIIILVLMIILYDGIVNFAIGIHIDATHIWMKDEMHLLHRTQYKAEINYSEIKDMRIIYSKYNSLKKNGWSKGCIGNWNGTNKYLVFKRSDRRTIWMYVNNYSDYRLEQIIKEIITHIHEGENCYCGKTALDIFKEFYKNVKP